MRESLSRERRFLKADHSADEVSRQTKNENKKWNGAPRPPQDDYLRTARNFYDPPAPQGSVVVETVYRRKKAFADLHQFDSLEEIDTVPTAVGFHSMDSLDEVEDAKSRLARYGNLEPEPREPEDKKENDDDISILEDVEGADEDGKVIEEGKDQKKAMLEELQKKPRKLRTKKKLEKEDEKKDDDTLSLLDNDYRYGPRPAGPVLPHGIFRAPSDDDTATCPPLWKSASEEEGDNQDREWMMQEARRVKTLNSVVIPESMYEDYARPHFEEGRRKAAEEAQERAAKKSQKKSFFRRLVVREKPAAAATPSDERKNSNQASSRVKSNKVTYQKKPAKQPAGRRFSSITPWKKKRDAPADLKRVEEDESSHKVSDQVMKTDKEEPRPPSNIETKSLVSEDDEESKGTEGEVKKDLITEIAEYMTVGIDSVMALFEWNQEHQQARNANENQEENVGEQSNPKADGIENETITKSTPEKGQNVERTCERSGAREDAEGASSGTPVQVMNLTLDQGEPELESQVIETIVTEAGSKKSMESLHSKKVMAIPESGAPGTIVSVSTIEIPTPALTENEGEEVSVSILGLAEKTSETFSKNESKTTTLSTNKSDNNKAKAKKTSLFSRLRRNKPVE